MGNFTTILLDADPFRDCGLSFLAVETMKPMTDAPTRRPQDQMEQIRRVIIGTWLPKAMVIAAKDDVGTEMKRMTITVRRKLRNLARKSSKGFAMLVLMG
jgi:hypothetical protein